MSIPIVACGLFVNYWVDKWYFLRLIKTPEHISDLLANFFTNMLPVFALVWAGSLMVFFREIYSNVF